MADILWSNVVGSKTIASGGYVGDLLAVARAHVDDAVTKGRLTQAQAGEIYTQMIPAAFQQGLSFELEEKLKEAQITSEVNKGADILSRTAINSAESVKELLLKDEKIYSEQYIQQANIAKTLDTYGFAITQDSYTQSIEPNLTHTQLISKAKQDALTASSNRELSVSKVKESEMGVIALISKVKSEYGVDADIGYYMIWKSSGEVLTPTERSLYYAKETVDSGFISVYDLTDVNMDASIEIGYGPTGLYSMNNYNLTLAESTDVVTNILPQSKHHAEMLQARVQSNIGINTWKGYEADTHFKVYKSLQELFFSLGTAGVESATSTTAPSEVGGIYASVTASMEKAMNSQIDVWNPDIASDIKITPVIG